MLFSPGMFCYGRFFCFPFSSCWVVLLDNGSQGFLGFTNVHLTTGARDPVYHTTLLRGRSTSLILVSCCLSVEIVVNAVLMSNFLRILLRSSLNPDTYCRQILYFGSPASCSHFLCFCADLIVFTGYSLAFETFFVTCFTFFSTFSLITTVLARLNRHDATRLLTCWGWWEV